MDKKGQIVTSLQSLGIGLVALAIIIGVGIVVLAKFNTTLAVCNPNLPYNETTENCYNSTDGVTGNTDPTNTAWVTGDYLMTQMGSTGLAGWVPAVIALTVGMLFLGAFLMRGRRSF